MSLTPLYNLEDTQQWRNITSISVIIVLQPYLQLYLHINVSFQKNYNSSTLIVSIVDSKRILTPSQVDVLDNSSTWETRIRLVGYWLGGALNGTGLGEDFPQLPDIGTTSRDKLLHKYTLDTILDAIVRGTLRAVNRFHWIRINIFLNTRMCK